MEETFGSDADNEEEWKKVVTKKLGLDAAKAPWITDESLRKFFREEKKIEVIQIKGWHLL